ncbi:glycosyltransferase [Granulicella sibirica]|nr:glycosyltransferase [Granulicella sibirica]
MSLALRILFGIAAGGSITSTVYCGMVLVATVRFGLRRRREEALAAQAFPPLSVLKPLHGNEAGLEENLVRYFEQDYPAAFELLFCARHETDEGLRLARRVADRYPGVGARFITCGEPEFPNAKMWSLAALARAARFETLVTSDADARVERNSLRECVKGLMDGTALESCLYIGTTQGGVAAKLDALGKSVEMTGGVLVADMLEGTRFALGVTMVLRKEAFERAGGHEQLGQFWAEDFVLGNRLADRGDRVGLSSHVIGLTVPPTGFGASFRNQVRWLKSTRRSRPKGHLGTGLTFAVPYGVMGLLWGLLAGHWELGVLWLAGLCLSRWVMAVAVLRALGGTRVMAEAVLYPVRDLMGGILWAASYWGSTLSYHGGTYQLEEDGRFHRRATTSGATIEQVEAPHA